MKPSPEISHELICGYLAGNLTAPENEQIARSRKDDPTTELLFDLLDQLKASFDAAAEAPDAPDISLDELGEQIDTILYGRPEKTETALFAQRIFHFPYFYDLVMIKLSQVGELLTPSSDPLPEIPMKTADEVLDFLGIKEGESRQKKMPGVNGTKGKKVKKIPLILDFDFSKYIVAATVSLVAFIFVFQGSSKTLESIGYSAAFKSEPYEYDPKVLRSSITNDSNTDFFNRFQNAMAQYEDLNYSRTSELFLAMEDSAKTLIAETEDEMNNTLLREYYFYRGHNNLKLYRSPEVDETAKALFLDAAIENLTQAVLLAQKLEAKIADKDKDIYFLGFAYFLNGEKEKANEQFNKIIPGSKFYPDSQILRSDKMFSDIILWILGFAVLIFLVFGLIAYLRKGKEIKGEPQDSDQKED